MRHAAFSILPPFSILFEFSVHSASVYLAKISSDESSDSKMPHDSSDEEVWEEEEVSGDDDSDGRPGFLDHLACEIYRNKWIGKIDLRTLFQV